MFINPTTDTGSQQIFSVVSSAYVSERHSGDHEYSLLGEHESVFEDLLRSLRFTLSVRREH